MTPPTTTEASTMSSGPAEPTSAIQVSSKMSAMLSAATTSVTRPRACMMSSRVRSGRRPPTSTPSAAPTTIAAILSRVPSPITG